MKAANGDSPYSSSQRDRKDEDGNVVRRGRIPTTTSNSTISNAAGSSMLHKQQQQEQQQPQQERQPYYSSGRKKRALRQQQQQQPEEFEPWEICLCYHFVMVMLAILTLTCPTDAVHSVGNGTARTTSTSSTNLLLLHQADDGYYYYAVMPLGILMAMTSLTFFAVHGSDPGRLTVEIMEEEEEEEEERLTASSDNQSVAVASMMPLPPPPLSASQQSSLQQQQSSSSSSSRRPHNNNNKKKNNRRPWCRKCCLAPPLRAHHCNLCHACVATYDHHCEYIGACIGERNRGRFWWLLFLQVLGIGQCCAVLVWGRRGGDGGGGIGRSASPILIYNMILAHWKQDDDEHQEPQLSLWKLFRIILAEVSFCLAAMIAIFLFILHSSLALTNLTTFEYIKWRHLEYLHGIPPYQSPFHEGILRNLQIYFGFAAPASTKEEEPSSSSLSSSANVWRPIMWETASPLSSSRQKHVD